MRAITTPSWGGMTVLVAGVLVGCRKEGPTGVGPDDLEPVPATAEFRDPMCLPVDDPARSPTHAISDSPVSIPSGDFRLGESVGVVSFGLSPGKGPYSYDQHMDVITGAPVVPIGPNNSGLARWVSLDPATGAFQDPSAFADAEAGAPPGLEGFGEAVLAVDVHPHQDLKSISPRRLIAVIRSGQEVVVGAPASEGDTGKIAIYRSRIDASYITAAADRSVWEWELDQTLDAPDSGPLLFGAALAAPPTAPGDRASWFAVGAPGGERVYIYGLVGAYYPKVLDVIQTIDLSSVAGAPSGVRGFGATLSADDLDQDGFPDLVVGAPDGAHGHVAVIRGLDPAADPTSTDVLDVNDVAWTDIGTLRGSNDRFGDALAVGKLFQNADPIEDSPVGIAIGAPGAHGGDGAVCVIGVSRFTLGYPIGLELPGGATVPECIASPITTPGGAAFGSSVAIGNFSPYDPYLTQGSASDLVEELAVGAPGADDLAWDTVLGGFRPVDGPESTTGLVVFYRSLSSGPVLTEIGPFASSERPLGERILRPATASAAFGSSMVAADIQRTGATDLIVGAPEHPHTPGSEGGILQVMNSAAVNGLEGNDGGFFVSTDSEGNDIDLTAVQGTRLFVRTEDEFVLQMTEDDPDNPGERRVCEAKGDVMSFEFALEFAVDHELGGGDTTLSLAVDTEGEVMALAAWDDDLPAWAGTAVDLTFSDVGYGDGDPSNDQIIVGLSNLRVWGGGGFGGLKWISSDHEISPARGCEMEGNPFVFTRVGSFEGTCD